MDVRREAAPVPNQSYCVQCFRWGDARTGYRHPALSDTQPPRSAPAHLAASEAFQTSGQRLDQTIWTAHHGIIVVDFVRLQDRTLVGLAGK